MRGIAIAELALLAVLVESAGGAAQQAAPPADSAARARAEGRALFMKYNCYGCHGVNGGGGMGPSLRALTQRHPEKADSDLFRKIKYGGGRKPVSFGDVLSDRQIHALVAFIRSLTP